MSKFRPFRAFRPVPSNAKQVASRPYDVLDSNEAREEAKDNPISFLRVIKPEIDLLPTVDPYGEEVYWQGLAKLNELKEQGILVQDKDAYFYIYRLTMDGRSQTGIVGCCDYQEYYDESIKKHELTRTAKENDRVRHVETQNANAEPVFFSYRGDARIDDLVSQVTDSAWNHFLSSQKELLRLGSISHRLGVGRSFKASLDTKPNFSIKVILP